MPANKNAVIRYMYLDQMLSDRHHYYTRTELCEQCNERLVRDGFSKVSKRTIELDLVDMGMSPFNMEIDDSLTIDGKHIVRYADQTQSLFSKPLSEDEKILLTEVLNTLGQFSGVDSFSWIQDLREKLSDNSSFGKGSLYADAHLQDDEKTIISFEENKYLKNKEYLSRLFSYISNRQVITVTYQKFSEAEAKRYTVYPYMLKQYSNRWYLLCTPVGDDTCSYNPELVIDLPLDRFAGEIILEKRRKFKECAVNLEERFEEILGITYFEDNPVDEVVFAVKNNAVPFIETKPIHESQRVCLDMDYYVEGYKTFCIECRYNYELLSTLSSFGDEIIILAPLHLRQKMLSRLEAQMEAYKLTE